MHFKETFFRYREDASSAVSSAAIVSLACFVVDAPIDLLFVVALIASVLGWWIRSVIALVSGFLLSLISWVLIALVLRVFIPAYSVSGQVVLTSALAMTVFFAVLLRPYPRIDNESRITFPLFSLVGIFVYLTSPGRSWTSENAFGALVSNGEDNAAWLVALSRSVVDGETRLSVASGTSGGPGTGVLINYVRQLMSSIGEADLVSSADNGLVLMRSYVFIAVVLAVMWFLVAFKMLPHRDLLTQTLFGLVAGVVSYVFSMGLAAVGHYSAVVAVLFLSAAVYFAVMMPTPDLWALWLSRGLVFVSLIAAGQSWFPLTGIAFVFAGLVVFFLLRPFLQKRPTKKQLRIATWATSVLVVFAYLSYTRLFPSFFQNVTSIDYITYNLTLPGGYSTVNPWLVMLSFALVLWWTFTYSHADAIANNSLVIALIFPIVGLFTWSYFLAPFTPQYGAWKYLYMGAAVVAPLAVLVAGVLMPSNASPAFTRVMPAAIVLLFALYSPPWNNIRWVDAVEGDGYTWVAPVVRELREFPTRPVGCLNTLESDTSQNYIGYLCSRMAFGLGGFDDARHRVWTAGNICTVFQAQTTFEWPQSELEKLTVILFDGTRTSSFAGCQAATESEPNGWLSSIDWSVVRKLDPNGKVVEIPATQPTKK
ncbi:unannotated protein [freshwater metagenome]|uniref:Unannotated protein n=1 Tax=freshwater metagenome TaxID=449393 RepID=A0A6J6DJG5_9ZZZZ|nr:hypothetical protein [Actinomycetota bacterium]